MERFGRDVGLGGDRQRLGVERAVAERQEVVQKLHRVPRADRPDRQDAPGPAFDHRAHAFERGLVGTDHAVERAVPRLLRRAAQGRVDEGDAGLRAQFGKARRRDRVGRRRVDDDEPLARMGEEPVRAGDQRLHLRRARQAQADHVAGGRQFGGRPDLDAAPLGQILGGLAAAVAQEAQREAGLHDVFRHAVAHVAEADEAMVSPRSRCWVAMIQSPDLLSAEPWRLRRFGL